METPKKETIPFEKGYYEGDVVDGQTKRQREIL